MDASATPESDINIGLPTKYDTLNLYKAYERASYEFAQKVEDINKLIEHIGGDQCEALHKELKVIPNRVPALVLALRNVVSKLGAKHEVKRRVRILENGFSSLSKLLYRQRREIRILKSLIDNLRNVRELVLESEVVIDENHKADLNAIYNTLALFKELFATATTEFDEFLKTTLPVLIHEEEERAISHYLNFTTIATFFSSVTATMLQLSYSLSSGVGGAGGTANTANSTDKVVNLCWFLSLVLSVTSGISSLLSISWRKSAVYYSALKQMHPSLIKVWIVHAPIVLLSLSAITFIAGLNAFVFASQQAHYVVYATIASTSALFICSMISTAWFLIRNYWFNLSYHWQKTRRLYHWLLCHDDQMFSVNHHIADLECWDDERACFPLKKGFLIMLSIKTIARNNNPALMTAVPIHHVGQTSGAMDRFFASVRKTFAPPPGSSIELLNKFHQTEDYFQTLAHEWNNRRCLADNIERDGKYLLWGYPHLQALLQEAVAEMQRQERQHAQRLELEEKALHTLKTRAQRILTRSQAQDRRMLLKAQAEECDALLREQGDLYEKVLGMREDLQALRRNMGDIETFLDSESNLLWEHQNDQCELIKKQEEDQRELIEYHVEGWHWLVEQDQVTTRRSCTPEEALKEQDDLREVQEEDERALRDDQEEWRTLLRNHRNEMRAVRRAHKAEEFASPRNAVALVQKRRQAEDDLIRVHVEEQDSVMRAHIAERNQLPLYQTNPPLVVLPDYRGDQLQENRRSRAALLAQPNNLPALQVVRAKQLAAENADRAARLRETLCRKLSANQGECTQLPELRIKHVRPQALLQLQHTSTEEWRNQKRAHRKRQHNQQRTIREIERAQQRAVRDSERQNVPP